MKANEFVKKFGWGWAKDVVNNQPKTDAQIFNPYNQKYSSSYNIKKGVSVAWLKRIVESHEFINERGGLEHVKNLIETKLHWFDVDAIIKTKQAIADVESCQ